MSPHSSDSMFFPIPQAPQPAFDMDQLNEALDQEFESKLQETLTKTSDLIHQLHEDIYSFGIPDLSSAYEHLKNIHDTLLWLVDLPTARMILSQSHNYRSIQEYTEQNPQDFAPLMPLIWHLMSDVQFDEWCSVGLLPNHACSLSEPLACALLKALFERPVHISAQNITLGILYSIFSERPAQLELYLNYSKSHQLALPHSNLLVVSPSNAPHVEESLTLLDKHGYEDPDARALELSGALNILQAALLSASTPSIAPILAFASFPTISYDQFSQALHQLLAQAQWTAQQQEQFSQRAHATFNHYLDILASMNQS